MISIFFFREQIRLPALRAEYADLTLTATTTRMIQTPTTDMFATAWADTRGTRMDLKDA